MKATCSFEGCTKTARCRSWCSAHYERWRKYGDPAITLPPVPPPIQHTQSDECTVGGCAQRPLARNLCDAHYRKQMKYGDPTFIKRVRNTCRVDGCDDLAHGHRLCTKHYLRWRQHGDPLALLPTYSVCQVDGCERQPRSARTPHCEMHYYREHRHGDPTIVIDTRQPDAGYRAAHQRIAQDRGRAAQHACVDCGQRAHHWSYAHTDEDERCSPGGQPYSLDPRHYEPRCASCHATFDLAHGHQVREPSLSVTRGGGCPPGPPRLSTAGEGASERGGFKHSRIRPDLDRL